MITVDAMIVPVGEPERTKNMSNKILQGRNVLGIEDRVRHLK